MLRPSYSDLLTVLNKDSENDYVVKSRYTIVISVAKRARQIVDLQKESSQNHIEKPVSVAVNELYTGAIRIKSTNQQTILENDDND